MKTLAFNIDLCRRTLIPFGRGSVQGEGEAEERGQKQASLKD